MRPAALQHDQDTRGDQEYTDQDESLVLIADVPITSDENIVVESVSNEPGAFTSTGSLDCGVRGAGSVRYRESVVSLPSDPAWLGLHSERYGSSALARQQQSVVPWPRHYVAPNPAPAEGGPRYICTSSTVSIYA
jgi:hypothetical protein